jgi:hypothetical protein
MRATWANSSGWIRTTDLTIMSHAPPCEGRPRRASEDKKFLQGGYFAGAHACRMYPPVFALVDPRWIRAEGRPRWPPHRDRPPGTTPAERRHARRSCRGRPRRLALWAFRRLPQRSSVGLFPGFRRMRDGMAMQELVEQEGAGGRRRPVDGSDRSGLGLGRRTAGRGALRTRTPAQNRRAATHATRSGARGAQKLQTAPSGRENVSCCRSSWVRDRWSGAGRRTRAWRAVSAVGV